MPGGSNTVVRMGLQQAALAADQSHLVSKLPGQPQVNFNQYAGQVTVNPTAGKALFYWFYEADHQNSSLQLPLAIWMNGGPGCSSVGAGALGELGPFRTNEAGSGLVLNPYAWNQVVNLIFLEAPHGVGFSYSNTTADYNQYSDDIMASDVLVFILEWIKRFPEYSKNDFYLLGESYAGHYVPTLAAKILDYNKKKARAFINFKGFALGNPWSDTYSDNKGNTDFFHSHSLVSDEIYNQVVANCDFAKDLSSDANPLCRFAVSTMFNSIQYVDTYNVYAPACNQQDPNGTILSQTLRENAFMHTEMLAAAYNSCADTVSPYLNSKDVQTALHVEFMPGKWSFCSRAANENYPIKEITNSMLPLYRSLLKEGLKIWIYSGDVDGVVSTIGMKAWIKKLNLTITQKWYPWKFQDQVGGWSEKYAGLMLVTVRGTGHMVPFDKPEQALLLFQHFVDGSSLLGF
ncbi:putative serine carboxypeptidase-like 23 [Selaginella moellendorffii]|uniref:putative serine carboxypeptidase-like 23 n=1 Tax=Selaginella moellendorffii TaxID=88036 RepID=UPI000D1C2CB2|nr:putative serine carboxypeptidase-like 23 [Selaginella moellendorffii]|eukprot:XP_024540990.1 putative serine carboxypeptidase-like 23 [Selaginella moellendorffii]